MVRRFEDYTREERAGLITTELDSYMALLGADQLYLLLDGLARSKPYVPEPKDEETWRQSLRRG